MMHNNLEAGYGLFISVHSVKGELWKKTDVSSPVIPLARSKAIVKRKHVGSMVELLEELQESSTPEQKGVSALEASSSG